MIKVKFFGKNTQFDLEIEVNEFIKNKKIINISYSIAECGYGYIHGCCILYEN